MYPWDTWEESSWILKTFLLSCVNNLVGDHLLLLILKIVFSHGNKTSSPCGCIKPKWPCYQGAMCHSRGTQWEEDGVNRSSPCTPGTCALPVLFPPQARYRRGRCGERSSSRPWRAWLQLSSRNPAHAPLTLQRGCTYTGRHTVSPTKWALSLQ